jgi:hypothetical protein
MNDIFEYLTNLMIIIVMSMVIITCAVIDLVDRNASIILLGGSAYILYKYLSNKN